MPAPGQEEHDLADHSWLWGNHEQADINVVLVNGDSMRTWRRKVKAACQQRARASKRACTDQRNVAEAADNMQAGTSSEHIVPEGHHIEANNEYFRKRITGFTDDPCTLKQPDGHLTLVVEVEEELMEAARTVVRLMYQGAVPQGLSPRKVAKMAHVADMWIAPACVRKCLVALTQLENPWQKPEELSAVLSWLPDSTSALPQYAAWEQKWQKHVISTFPDVHALLTSYSLLQQFRCLPFSAVRAWAASDDLRVDSENSVAVALSWWCGGQGGCDSSNQQLEELSGLLRVSKLSTAYRLNELPKLPWFRYQKQDLGWLQTAAAVGVYEGCPSLPPGWLAKPRQPSASSSSTTINWDIPQAELHAALAKKESTDLFSQPVYFAGTGMRLLLQVQEREADTAPRDFGLFLQPCAFTCEMAKVTSAHQFVPVKSAISHKAGGQARVLTTLEAVIREGWGVSSALTASSPLSLQPLLSDGFLKLSATLEATQ